jgi:hypothetical protein
VGDQGPWISIKGGDAGSKDENIITDIDEGGLAVVVGVVLSTRCAILIANLKGIGSWISMRGGDAGRSGGFTASLVDAAARELLS